MKGQSTAGELGGMTKGARMEGPYRYTLLRRWGDGPTLVWVMLNPSTADEMDDDPTIRRCIGFTRRWRGTFGALVVVNLFAFRATQPTDLADNKHDIVGPKNDEAISDEASRAGGIVVAWGAEPMAKRDGRDAAVLDLLEEASTTPVLCLGTTAHGSPRHPLYVKRDVRPCRYVRPA